MRRTGPPFKSLVNTEKADLVYVTEVHDISGLKGGQKDFPSACASLANGTQPGKGIAMAHSQSAVGSLLALGNVLDQWWDRVCDLNLTITPDLVMEARAWAVERLGEDMVAVMTDHEIVECYLDI